MLSLIIAFLQRLGPPHQFVVGLERPVAGDFPINMRLGASRHDVPDPLRGDRRRLGFVALRQPAGAGIDRALGIQGPVDVFLPIGENGLWVGYFGRLLMPARWRGAWLFVLPNVERPKPLKADHA